MDGGGEPDGADAEESAEPQPAGVGDQPGGESRDIPIAAAPPTN